MTRKTRKHYTAEFKREAVRLVETEGSKIASIRAEAGLTQRQLAKLIGTTASVICRLEDADYEGHSLATLNRIAAALNRKLEIRFVHPGRRIQSA